MCAGTDAKIKRTDISLEIGWKDDTTLVVGNETLIRNSDEFVAESKKPDKAMRKRLGKFSKDELIDILIQFVSNGQAD